MSQRDSLEFRNSDPVRNGQREYYIVESPEVWDTDDDNTTHVRGGGTPKLIQIVGNFKEGKKEGIFSFYLIDSADHSRRYKIWDQTYAGNKLNGEWKTYNLKGTVVRVQNFRNDSLHGLSRDFWIDGKSIMEEREYNNGQGEFIARQYYGSGTLRLEQTVKKGVTNGLSNEYYENGKLKEQLTVVNGVLNGPTKRFYEDGTLMEEAFLLDGKLHKTRKYFYPSGKTWIEQEYRNGLPWNIIANYDQNGQQRDGGTLKEGNGTVILYNEDGSVREILKYVNGQKS